jgi:hypothetical protein
MSFPSNRELNSLEGRFPTFYKIFLGLCRYIGGKYIILSFNNHLMAETSVVWEKRTKDDPWKLKTPPQSSDYEMYIDEKDGREIIMCVVGSTKLYYDSKAIGDLHQMLKDHDDWMLLGSKDENVETKEGTVEHWARSQENPVGGWYGMRKGYRGRFAMYIPPLMEELGLAEVEHNKRSNRMRAL